MSDLRPVILPCRKVTRTSNLFRREVYGRAQATTEALKAREQARRAWAAGEVRGLLRAPARRTEVR